MLEISAYLTEENVPLILLQFKSRNGSANLPITVDQPASIDCDNQVRNIASQAIEHIAAKLGPVPLPDDFDLVLMDALHSAQIAAASK